MECEGLAKSLAVRFNKIIKLKGGQVLNGLSGSPLLNQRTGQVCGVVARSRNISNDLGGEAISTEIIFSELSTLKELHDIYHKTHGEWLELLRFDSEPFLSDWTYLDLDQSRISAYFKALRFLICTSIKWFIMGLGAPRAFPIETIQKLFKCTFKGNLGQEINRQRKVLSKRLYLEVNLEASGQAKIINQLVAQNSVLFHLINILVSNEQNLASLSRLAWASELIYEQQELLNDLKKIEGNYYPHLEKLKETFPFLKNSVNKDMYFKSDRILGRLVAQHTNTNFLLFHSLNNQLIYFIDILKNKPQIGLFFLDLFLEFAKNKNTMKSQSTKNIEYEDEFTERINAIFSELENSITKNPKLKILRKIKILLESVVGEPITGGKFRAWGKKRVYHFSRRCKLYPERARPHEMKKVLCYDTLEEAKQYHKACKTCLGAEKKSSSEEYFVGEEYSPE